MDTQKRAAIVALARIIEGCEPSTAIREGCAFVDGDADPERAADLLWARIRLPLEAGAQRWLEQRQRIAIRQRPTGVYGVGYDLARAWFPEIDKRGEGIGPDEAGELVRPWIEAWWTGSDVEPVEVAS